MNRKPINNNANINPAAIASNLPKFQDSRNGTVPAFSIVPYLRLRVFVEFYENCIKIRDLDRQLYPSEPPDRNPEDITNFSKNSRLRMFELLSTMQYSTYGEPVFVSATWHFDAPNNRIDLKWFLKKYLDRLRQKLPMFKVIWKLEFQQRGEPHFHFMFFPNSTEISFQDYLIKLKIVSDWQNYKTCACQDCMKHSCHVRDIKEYHHALIYISKEMAKLQDRYEDHNLGRVWGASHNIRTQSICNYEVKGSDVETLLDEMLNSKNINPKAETYLRSLKAMPRDCSIYWNFKELKPLVYSWKYDQNKKELKTGKLKMRKYNFGNQ